jgi:transcriptional regulator with PAS, ATPase and Fis domain
MTGSRILTSTGYIMPFKIGLIAPYQGLITKAVKLASSKGIRLATCRAVLDDATRAAEAMERQGVDTIIVREVTDIYIQGRISVPVIPIRIGGTDILKALLKARKLSNRIALANFYGRYKDINIVKEALGFDFQVFTFFTREEALEKIRALKGKVDVIIGGGLTSVIAQEQGFKGIMIESTDDSIKYSLEVACNIAKSRFEEEQKRRQLTTIVNLVGGGIVAVDQAGLIAVYNREAERIFQLPYEEVIGKRCDCISEAAGFHSVRDSGREYEGVVVIRDKSVFVRTVPITIKKKDYGGVATLHEASNVEEMDRNIRISLHSSGLTAHSTFDDIIGASNSLQSAIARAKKFANSDFTILITGETGTGKELFAQSIVNFSKRKNGPFLAINCASIPSNLLEAELFGYEEGSFTGARKGGKVGYFELAHEGTIFLDEIGDLSPELQTRLLRVIQEKKIIRVGGSRIIPIDVRVIAATNTSLIRQVNEGKFREDLYYRLNVLHLHIPPLRERIEDIPYLASNILRDFQHIKEEDRSVLISALSSLASHPWPGNIREMQNILATLTVLLQDRGNIDKKTVEQLLAEIIRNNSPAACKDEAPGQIDVASLKASRKNFEKQLFSILRNEPTANKIQIARKLGISRTTLWRKFREHGFSKN